MRDPVSSQYSSFLFWRMPIPELDLSELEGLGLSDTSIYKIKDSSAGKMTGQATGEQEKSSEGDSLLEYSTFNFWRAPIASIHSFDLDLALSPRLLFPTTCCHGLPFQAPSFPPFPPINLALSPLLC
uniref:Protein AF1q n=1 Tax=Neovison vison TaxID=452646 RepID=U6CNW5_NEOVI